MIWKRVVLIVLLVMGVSACTKPMDDKRRSSGKSESHKSKIEVVRTTPIDIQRIPRNVICLATLISSEEVNVASAVPGKIQRIMVDVGSRVTKGQVLVHLDRSPLQQARLQMQNLFADLQRLESLRQTGSVTVQQYEQIKTQYDVASANVDSLKENTDLIAPFDGIITGKYYEDGEMFSGAPNTPAGKAAIVSVAAIDPMKARVPVSEMFLPYISKQTPLQITAEVYGQETFSASVLRVYPTIDPATRTFITEIKIANPENRLRPGMSARVTLTLDQIEALMVPASAVLKLRGSNERFIFLEKSGKAERVIVDLGLRYNDRVEILSEKVHQGDHLIVAGQSRLLDGDAVTVEE